MMAKRKQVNLSVGRGEKSKTGGLTAKGRAKYNRATGSNLKAPVTGKVKPGSKAAKRRASFCARMKGMPGPMKDSKGRPTRKALALRKWRCRQMTYAVPGPIRTNIVSSTSVGGIDSPFTRTRAVLDMMKSWEIMKAVSEGTDYLRQRS